MRYVFFLKSVPPKQAPAGQKYVALDPPQQFMCDGVDPRCSTAYSAFILSLKDEQGRYLPRLKQKFAPDATEVAFMGFSAAHGFLNPLLNNDQDLAEISAVYLMDATFGGGKDGFIKAAKRAAAGDMLLVSPTSHTGGDKGFRNEVLEPAGLSNQIQQTSAVSPMPKPSGGVWRVGDLWYYRFVDGSGGSELPHWEMGKIQSSALDAHPPFDRKSDRSGTWYGGWKGVLLGVTAAVGGYWAMTRYRQRS